MRLSSLIMAILLALVQAVLEIVENVYNKIRYAVSLEGTGLFILFAIVPMCLVIGAVLIIVTKF